MSAAFSHSPVIDCEIGEEFMNSLGDALSVNRSLVKLDLWKNKFGGNACQRFSSGIKSNTLLKELDLSGSSFDPFC